MVSSGRRHHRYTYAEYVALELRSDTKHADGTVICGELKHHEPSPNATALNPLVLLEVTSDSSEEYDTGEKLDSYRTIPTPQECIIVSHRERRISVHRREAAGWKMRSAIAGGRVSIESLGTELSVDEIYRNSSIR